MFDAAFWEQLNPGFIVMAAGLLSPFLPWKFLRDVLTLAAPVLAISLLWHANYALPFGETGVDPGEKGIIGFLGLERSGSTSSATFSR